MRAHLHRVLAICFIVPVVYCACPCKNPAWCNPITDTSRKEVFMFTKHNNPSSWSRYDWTRTTTVGMAGYISTDLLCVAHQHNARVVLLVGYSADLNNQAKRSTWVQKQLKTVQENYLDGINIDYEKTIPQNRIDLITALTQLVNETYTAFKQALPTSQVTMDVPYGPNCVLGRCFDYIGLSEVVDFFFIMDYDNGGGHVARPNSDYQKSVGGLKEYLKIIQPSKLLMGFPWYGYRYKCSSLSKDNVCIVDGRGGSSSGAFSYYYNLMWDNHSKRHWNQHALSPFFNYHDATTGATYQVHYDDPESLIYKYNIASKYDLRGVGVWTADFVNYVDTPLDNAVRHWMWDALPLVQNQE